MRPLNLLKLLGVFALLIMVQPAVAAEFWGMKPGTVKLSSAGALAFGPEGVLFIGDSVGASIYAIKADDGPEVSTKAAVNVPNLSEGLAASLGVPASEIKVNDLAVNPKSGNIYLSVAAGKPAQGALLKIDPAGKISKIGLEDVMYARADLPDAPDSKEGRRGNPRNDAITDLAFRDGKLLVAGMAKGQSASTVREFAFPFSERPSATYIEIYHAAHGQVEDGSAMRQFVPLQINGEPVLLAGFTCTPLVSIPIKSLEAGKKVRGKTVAELGNRNRPLDMVVYEKDGQTFVLMANSARGVMKISLANIQENPGLAEPVRGGGTAGQKFESITSLQGVEQLDRLDDASAVILAKNDAGSFDLKTIELP